MRPTVPTRSQQPPSRSPSRSPSPSPRGAALLALALALAALLGAAPPGGAAEEGGGEAGEEKGFAERVAELEPRPGLLDLYVDASAGKVLAVVPPGGEAGRVGEYLYVEGLVTGLGSNPVGLDRGQIGDTRVVALRRVGGRLLVEERNLGFRALTDDPHERRATEDSFATSVLWAGPIEAEAEDGRGLVDLTSFVVRDAHGVAATLKRTGQGSWSLDEERSAVDLDACLAFPDNVELEAVLTYAGEEPGAQVESVAPTADTVTLVQHHSLLRLPDDGYRPRAFDPRAGSFAIRFADYAAALDEPIERRWIVRHRLEKRDPAAASSPAVEPIVYHVDRGAPEPVRSALVEGASWWAEAFAAAGFEDAFRVELLPEDAHPLDVRYHVIQWVHRSTRGWSYGGGVVDPRTGEMVKGHVTLGSLRVRQDRRIFEGLVGADASGTGGPGDPVEAALARIRQLSAHEVGHTLGLAHNFAASTYGRASVMDYPAPLVRVGPGGELDLSDAYGVGVGAWDRHAVRWAYSEPPPGTSEEQHLAAIVDEGLERGWLFLTDPDARPPGAGHPRASLWDNGEDPVAQLRLDAEVRRLAVERFDESRVAPGRPLALLEEVFATVYLRHRFQLTAAAKLIGGVDYRYAVRGDGQPPPRPVAAARQREALDALLDLLEPAELAVPDGVLDALHPRPAGYGENRELFAGRSGPLFDPLAAAATAADLVVAELLHPERAHRLVDLHRRDPLLPGLEEVLDALVERAFAAAGSERLEPVGEAVRATVVARLVALAEDPGAGPAVRARVADRLARLRAELAAAPGAHAAWLAAEIGRFEERRRTDAGPPPGAPAAPPGQPIGSAGGAPDLGGCSWSG